MCEAPRGHELGDVAYHCCQIHGRNLRVNVLANGEYGPPREILDLVPALLALVALLDSSPVVIELAEQAGRQALFVQDRRGQDLRLTAFEPQTY